MKEWHIWIEGYAATGESATAHMEGTCVAATFDEACVNFRFPADITDWQGKIIVAKGSPLGLDKNEDGSLRRGSFRGTLVPGVDRTAAVLKGGNYSIWCCQLFPTEAEARASFG